MQRNESEPRMTKQKRKRAKIRFDYVPRSLVDRLDMDYIERLDTAARKYLKKFIEEIYGRKFQDKPLVGKTTRDRKEIYHETYAANEDIYNVCARVQVDPHLVELNPSRLQDKASLEPLEIKAEIEREYIENGVKITRLKPIKPTHSS